VIDTDNRMLMEAILDYMRWVKSVEEYRGSRSSIRYTRILIDFLFYVIHKGISWKEMFTMQTLEAFQTYSGYKAAHRAIKALSDYLFSQGRIDQPLQSPKARVPLPDIYEQYLFYHQQSLQVCDAYLGHIRKILLRFHDYLQKQHIELCALGIEHLDAFMATFKVARSSHKTYRHYLRGFLKYLYHQRGILKKDLASLLVGPPLFDQGKPPKFLRAGEIKKLFESLKLSTPTDIRNYAIVHLTYTLALRPVEVARVSLDDLSFRKRQLALPHRKADHPITLPVPENTLKAIAAYVLKARPNRSPYRHLFLCHQFPYRPMRAHYVVQCLSGVMKKAGLSCSGYWLRHTYAQNLLQIGRSIYEIKEMLGHQSIQASQRYIHIHTELMRKVLFNEEL
jgi:site-specific recombinase XerD